MEHRVVERAAVHVLQEVIDRVWRDALEKRDVDVAERRLHSDRRILRLYG